MKVSVLLLSLGFLSISHSHIFQNDYVSFQRNFIDQSNNFNLGNSSNLLRRELQARAVMDKDVTTCSGTLVGEIFTRFTAIFFGDFTTSGGQDCLGPLAVGGTFTASSYTVNANHGTGKCTNLDSTFGTYGLVVGTAFKGTDIHVHGAAFLPTGTDTSPAHIQMLDSGCTANTNFTTGLLYFQQAYTIAVFNQVLFSTLSPSIKLDSNGKLSQVGDAVLGFDIMTFNTCNNRNCPLFPGYLSNPAAMLFGEGNWNGPSGMPFPKNIIINVPVNVGTSITLYGNQPSLGLTPCNTIWNFYPSDKNGVYSAGEISIFRNTGGQLGGLILSPDANIYDYSTGNFAGLLIANNYAWSSNGVEIHDYRAVGGSCSGFSGCFPISNDTRPGYPAPHMDTYTTTTESTSESTSESSSESSSDSSSESSESSSSESSSSESSSSESSSSESSSSESSSSESSSSESSSSESSSSESSSSESSSSESSSSESSSSESSSSESSSSESSSSESSSSESSSSESSSSESSSSESSSSESSSSESSSSESSSSESSSSESSSSESSSSESSSSESSSSESSSSESSSSESSSSESSSSESSSSESSSSESSSSESSSSESSSSESSSSESSSSESSSSESSSSESSSTKVSSIESSSSQNSSSENSSSESSSSESSSSEGSSSDSSSSESSSSESSSSKSSSSESSSSESSSSESSSSESSSSESSSSESSSSESSSSESSSSESSSSESSSSESSSSESSSRESSSSKSSTSESSSSESSTECFSSKTSGESSSCKYSESSTPSSYTECFTSETSIRASSCEYSTLSTASVSTECSSSEMGSEPSSCEYNKFSSIPSSTDIQHFSSFSATSFDTGIDPEQSFSPVPVSTRTFSADSTVILPVSSLVTHNTVDATSTGMISFSFNFPSTTITPFTTYSFPITEDDTCFESDNIETLSPDCLCAYDDNTFEEEEDCKQYQKANGSKKYMKSDKHSHDYNHQNEHKSKKSSKHKSDHNEYQKNTWKDRSYNIHGNFKDMMKAVFEPDQATDRADINPGTAISTNESNEKLIDLNGQKKAKSASIQMTQVIDYRYVAIAVGFTNIILYQLF